MAKLDPTQPVTMADIEKQRFNAQMVRDAIDKLQNPKDVEEFMYTLKQYGDPVLTPSMMKEETKIWENEESLWNS